uniref:Ankyrin repeat domain 44 n=1 Tax=Nothobranchius furzeri TaxID=105023 RepID=A0A8C6L4J5_NOTFU
SIILTLTMPPLIQAIFSGDPEEIRMLIYKSEDINLVSHTRPRCCLHAAGARVNAKDNMWLTPLHRAVASRSEDAVRVLIRHSADVNARDKNWQTPLHVAAANNAIRCAEVIIPLLSSVNVSDRGGRTALHHAALNGHTEMVSLLLAKGANINAFDKKDGRALHWASFMGHLDVVCLLLSQGAEVSCKDKRGYTPLHAAAARGEITVVKHLLNLAVEIDEPNAFGNTALHVACFNGQDAVVSELIDYGANVSQSNNKGFTPLHFAAASTHGALCLEFLVNNGADVNVQSRDGKSPLHMTAVHGRFTRSQTLIQNGGEIDSMDKDGNTPLHVAARYGHELLINTLITSGADCTRRGIHGMFPLHLAALNAHSDCCRKLLSSGRRFSIMCNDSVLSAGFQIDTPDSLGRTCLHAAAAGGNVDCVKLLLSSGGEHNKADKCGRTPLHYAAASRHYQCLETLVACGTDINATDQWGRSALHYAAASDLDRSVPPHLASPAWRSCQSEFCLHCRCLEFLLQSGATASLKDKQGYSPVHYAAAFGHRHCLELVSHRSSFDKLLNCLKDGSVTHLLVSPQAYHGDAQALEVLLQGQREVDQGDEAGRTPLALAALRGHTDCVHTLLSQGASPHSTDKQYGRTPVHLAVMNGHTTCVRLLLEESDSSDLIDAADFQGQTPLMLAVAGGHLDTVSLLLERDAHVNMANSHGLTALHLGLLCGQEECVQCLLEHEASVLLGDSRGRTAIHLAASRGHASWLSELLSIACSESPSLPPLRDHGGYTPLHWACYYGHEGCVEVLLEQKGCRCIDGNPFTPLHCAVGTPRAGATLSLWRFESAAVGLHRIIRFCSCRTPLHAAAFAGHVDCVNLLLSHDAPVDSVDQSGRSALMMAAEKGRAETVEVLLTSAGASLSLADQDGNTALHLACSNGKEECVLLILEKLSDASLINATNAALQTPLHLAARSGLKKVVQELLSRGASVQTVDENGLTPALACAPSREVADCLALILATMMPFCSPCSSGAPSPGSLLRQLPHQGSKGVCRGSPCGPAGTSLPHAHPPTGVMAMGGVWSRWVNAVF